MSIFQKINTFKNNPNIVFIFCILSYFSFFYNDVLFYPPSHIHLWTQSDRYALSLGYLENGFNFFKPQTYNLATANGITGVDFPINEYIVALIMKVFNSKDPSIFRIYNLTIAICSYWVLYRFVLTKTNSIFKAVFVITFVFTLPIITYYQAGFLPSTSGFSFTVIGLVYYFYYVQSNRNKQLIVAITMIALAALVRTPFVLYLTALLLHQIYIQFNSKKLKTANLLIFTLAFIAIFCWQWYKYYLNKMYGSQFLNTILPAASFNEFISNTNEIIKRWKNQLFTVSHYVILISSLAILIRNRIRSTFLLITMSVFFVFYYIAMNQQFIHHEYYFIDSFYIMIVLLISFGLNYLPLHERSHYIVASILLLSCVGFSKKVQNEKYSNQDWDYAEKSRKGYINADKFLDSIGIPKDAKVLVIDAFASNYPLIQLGRKGYTLINKTKASIDSVLRLDFDYVVAQKTFLLSEIINRNETFLHNVKAIASNESFIVFVKQDAVEPLSKVDIAELVGFKHIEQFNADSTYNKTVWSKINYSQPLMCYTISPKEEYGPTFIIKDKPNFDALLFEGTFNFKDLLKPLVLCITLHKSGKQIYYSEIEFYTTEKEKFQKRNFLFNFKQFENKYDELRCFISNRNGNQISYKELTMKLNYNKANF